MECLTDAVLCVMINRLKAAVVEQADTRDLKSLGVKSVPVRSRSAAPKKRERPMPLPFLWSRGPGSNPSQCKCPVDTCCHQFANWWLQLFFSPPSGEKNANRSRSAALPEGGEKCRSIPVSGVPRGGRKMQIDPGQRRSPKGEQVVIGQDRTHMAGCVRSVFIYYVNRVI